MMSEVGSRNVQSLIDATDHIKIIDDITSMIDGIKDKRFTNIQCYGNEGGAQIEITEKNKDMIVQMLIELKRHHKSVLNSMISTVNTQVNDM